MPNTSDEKFLLIQKVFEKAQKESSKNSKNALATYLEAIFLDDLKFRLSYRTFERYYKYILEKEKPNYNIDSLTLDTLSKYIGYKHFKDFIDISSRHEKGEKLIQSEKENKGEGLVDTKSLLVEKGDKNALIQEATNNEEKKKTKIILTIQTMSVIVFILFFVLLFYKFENKSNIVEKESKINNVAFKENSDRTASIPIQIKNNTGNVLVDIKPKVETKIITKRKKECMFWSQNRYDSVYCDSNKESALEVWNSEQYKIKKITQPDTLTIHNSIGKVWYSKNKGEIEFFTNRGYHPVTKKELKVVSH